MNKKRAQACHVHAAARTGLRDDQNGLFGRPQHERVDVKIIMAVTDYAVPHQPRWRTVLAVHPVPPAPIWLPVPQVIWK